MAASRRSSTSRSAIAVGRGLEHRIGHAPAALRALAFEPVEEAAPPPGVAGDAAHRFHLEDDRVAIAVEPDLAHALHVTRGLALLPQGAARARPVHRLAA